MSISQKQLNILRHAIGYDDAGNDRWHGAAEDARRNHFVTGPGSTDFPDCAALVAKGFMTDQGPHPVAGGDHCFSVTTEGRQCVALHQPKPRKLTRSQERYRRFLRVGDCFGSFLEFCRYDAAQSRRGV